MAKKTTKKIEVAQNVQPATVTPEQVMKQPPAGYNTRVCVPAPMPVQCPHCRSSRTTAANGVHYNLHFGSRYEHRVCGSCGYTFTAMRRMTAEELAEKSPKNG